MYVCLFGRVSQLSKKKARAFKRINYLISAVAVMFSFLLGSYIQTMPNEDTFCTSLPSQLYWGMCSNSSLHSYRLRKVGSRISRELVLVCCITLNKMGSFRSTIENAVSIKALWFICDKFFTEHG